LKSVDIAGKCSGFANISIVDIKVMKNLIYL